MPLIRLRIIPVVLSEHMVNPVNIYSPLIDSLLHILGNRCHPADRILLPHFHFRYVEVYRFLCCKVIRADDIIAFLTCIPRFANVKMCIVGFTDADFPCCISKDEVSCCKGSRHFFQPLLCFICGCALTRNLEASHLRRHPPVTVGF